MMAFRRLFIDRLARRIGVETAPGEVYLLPGAYDPDKMFEAVRARRYIDPTKWEKL